MTITRPHRQNRDKFVGIGDHSHIRRGIPSKVHSRNMYLSLFLIFFSIIGNINAFSGIQSRILRTGSRAISMSNVEATQVYVANLPFALDESTLSDIVKEKSVSNLQSVKIIKDKETGKSRGFGYLTFSTKDEAEMAVSALKNTEVDGRLIKVDLSNPSSSVTDKPPRSPKVVGVEHKLFVGNIAFQATENDVESLVENILGKGILKKVDIVVDKLTKRPRGFGYIHFNTKEGMDTALVKLNGAKLLDRDIRLDTAGGRSTGSNKKYSIYIGNLPWEISEKIIDEMLSDIVGPGLVTNIRMGIDKNTGRSKGFCHVDFIDAESMERALVELEQTTIYDRELKIDRAVSKEWKNNNDGGLTSRKRTGERYDNSDSEQQSNFNSW